MNYIKMVQKAWLLLAVMAAVPVACYASHNQKHAKKTKLVKQKNELFSATQEAANFQDLRSQYSNYRNLLRARNLRAGMLLSTFDNFDSNGILDVGDKRKQCRDGINDMLADTASEITLSFDQPDLSSQGTALVELTDSLKNASSAVEQATEDIKGLITQYKLQLTAFDASSPAKKLAALKLAYQLYAEKYQQVDEKMKELGVLLQQEGLDTIISEEHRAEFISMRDDVKTNIENTHPIKTIDFEASDLDVQKEIKICCDYREKLSEILATYEGALSEWQWKITQAREPAKQKAAQAAAPVKKKKKIGVTFADDASQEPLEQPKRVLQRSDTKVLPKDELADAARDEHTDSTKQTLKLSEAGLAAAAVAETKAFAEKKAKEEAGKKDVIAPKQDVIADAKKPTVVPENKSWKDHWFPSLFIKDKKRMALWVALFGGAAGYYEKLRLKKLYRKYFGA